jgi:hypothetical protein
MASAPVTDSPAGDWPATGQEAEQHTILTALAAGTIDVAEADQLLQSLAARYRTGAGGGEPARA